MKKKSLKIRIVEALQTLQGKQTKQSIADHIGETKENVGRRLSDLYNAKKIERGLSKESKLLQYWWPGIEVKETKKSSKKQTIEPKKEKPKAEKVSELKEVIAEKEKKPAAAEKKVNYKTKHHGKVIETKAKAKAEKEATKKKRIEPDPALLNEKGKIDFSKITDIKKGDVVEFDLFGKNAGKASGPVKSVYWEYRQGKCYVSIIFEGKQKVKLHNQVTVISKSE